MGPNDNSHAERVTITDKLQKLTKRKPRRERREGRRTSDRTYLADTCYPASVPGGSMNIESGSKQSREATWDKEGHKQSE